MEEEKEKKEENQSEMRKYEEDWISDEDVGEKDKWKCLD